MTYGKSIGQSSLLSVRRREKSYLWWVVADAKEEKIVLKQVGYILLFQ